MTDTPPVVRLSDHAGDRIAVVHVPGRHLAGPVLARLRAAYGDDLAAAAADPLIPAPAPHTSIVAEDDSPTALRRAGASAGRAAGSADVLDILVPTRHAEDFARGVVAGAAVVRSPQPKLRLVTTTVAAEAAARDGATVGSAVIEARTLANTPSDIKTPQWLAEQAAALTGLPTVVHGIDWLRQHGFGGLLGVAAGSAHDPALTVISHGAKHAGPHIVLVGKGITFDSGGLSLKPPLSMPLMKTDMGGAAAVIGTLAAVRRLNLPVRVTGVLACAENMPGATAMRPGDVVRHYGGRTTEVLNTDAEGRLVLADALAWAADALAPDVIVDLATLTGSATLGLGRQHAALYSTDDRLARGLTHAGDRSGDRVWRLPLVPEYRSAIASDIADSANTNTDSTTSAGSITAALFLEAFTGGVPWAHLDIAGVGRTESDRSDCRKGGTGFGVSLLVEWLSGRR